MLSAQIARGAVFAAVGKEIPLRAGRQKVRTIRRANPAGRTFDPGQRAGQVASSEFAPSERGPRPMSSRSDGNSGQGLICGVMKVTARRPRETRNAPRSWWSPYGPRRDWTPGSYRSEALQANVTITA